MDATIYRVTWWPTEDAPDGMQLTVKRRYQDVKIVEGETTFEDIRKIIAVYRSGNPDNARYVHVFAAIQIEGAM